MSETLYTIRPQSAPVWSPGLVPASPWRRLGAVLVNQLLAMVFAFAGLIVFTLLDGRPMSADGMLFGTLGIFGLLFALYFWLQIRLMRRHGQTVGKRVMKIRAVDAATGARLSAGRYFWRRECLTYVLNNLTGLPVLIDAVLVFLPSNRRRSLEDIIAGSVVVDAAD